MIFIYNIIKKIGILGKIIVFIFLLFFISTIIVSYKISFEKTYNPFCKNNYNYEKIIIEYQQIEEYEYNYDCSTMYFYIKVKSNLTKKDIEALLLSIGNDLKEYDFYTHFEIESDGLLKPIYASIDLKTQKLSIV